MSEDADRSTESPTEEDESTVLELFGVKLNVRNPRLAEVLTMDASEALVTDVRDLFDPAVVRETRTDSDQAVPEVILAPPTGRDLVDSKMRAEMRARSDSIGTALDFDVSPGGMWESPTGLTLITRVVERPLSYAAATDYVDKIGTVLDERQSDDATALFIVDSQETADVFKVAIRQRQLYGHVRTVSMGNLDDIHSLFGSGVIDHPHALVLLTPIVNADVGDVLDIIRAAAEGEAVSEQE